VTGMDGSGDSRADHAIGARPRGALALSFATTLHGLLKRAGLRPRPVSDRVRGMAFGTDGFRELIEPHYWVVLEAAPGEPSVLADVDSSTLGLERDVAKYVWWLQRGGPFWSGPALLVSGLAALPEEDAEVHKTIARSFGNELQRELPDLRHLMVEVDGEGTPDERGRLLAAAAFDRILESLEFDDPEEPA
jgi:hypothetical protein